MKIGKEKLEPNHLQIIVAHLIPNKAIPGSQKKDRERKMLKMSMLMVSILLPCTILIRTQLKKINGFDGEFSLEDDLDKYLDDEETMSRNISFR